MKEVRIDIVAIADCPNCKQTIAVESTWETNRTVVKCPSCKNEFIAYVEKEIWDYSESGKAVNNYTGNVVNLNSRRH
jgi:predicted Zn finger-like uncharacterized protein